jgi:Cation transporter/ATPase, N-terminus
MTVTARPAGLTSDEARRRLVEHGPNIAVPRRVRPRAWQWLTRALVDPMTLLLLVAAPTYLALGDTVSAAVAFAAIIPLALAGFVLETRAERALEELSRAAAPLAGGARGPECRSGAEPFSRVGTRGNRSLVWVVAVSIAMVIAVFALPPVRELLRLDALGPADAALAGGPPSSPSRSPRSPGPSDRRAGERSWSDRAVAAGRERARACARDAHLVAVPRR